MPEPVYFTYRIKNAHRDYASRFSNRPTSHEFLDMVEFSPTYAKNSALLDINGRYFHMFSGTKDYLILPLGSLAIQTSLFLTACREGDDLVKTMVFDENQNGEFRIFDKRNFKFIDQIWETDPYLQVHMIQAHQDYGHPDFINHFFQNLIIFYK